MPDGPVRERVKRVLAQEWDLARDAIPSDAARGRFERWDSLDSVRRARTLGTLAAVQERAPVGGPTA